MNTQAQRECQGCCRPIKKRRYSKNQWRKGPGASRCQDCVDNDAPPNWLNELDYDSEGSESPASTTLAHWLYEMCNYSCVNWDFVEMRLESHPEEAGEDIFPGNNDYSENRSIVCPIHVFLIHDPPLRVVKALVRAYPDVFRQYYYKESPLQKLCSTTNPNPKIVQYLLDATLRSRKHYSETFNPIGFIGADEKVSLKTFDLLLQLFPAGSMLVGDDEFCPFDAIFDDPRQEDFLAKLLILLEAAEHLVLPREHRKDFVFRPVHSLLSQNPLPLIGNDTEEIFRLLLDVCTGSEKSPAPNGQLPLHLALMNEWPEGCVQCVLRAFPDALHLRDPISKLYPFQMAACNLKPPLQKTDFAGVTDDDIAEQLRREEVSQLQKRMDEENSIKSSNEFQLERMNLSYTLLLQDPSLVSFCKD